MISYYAIPGIPHTAAKKSLIVNTKEEILSISLAYFGINLAELNKKTKAPLIVYRRAIISYLLYSTNEFTLMEISKIINFCHGSIHYYNEVVKDQLSMKNTNKYKYDISAIRLLLSNNQNS